MRPNYRQNAQWTYRTEVRVGIGMKITIMTIQEAGVEINMIVDPFNREERNPRPNLTPG